jgi:hypothetical protein
VSDLRYSDAVGVTDEITSVLDRRRTLADSITLKGEVEIVLRDSRGRFKARRKVKNLITTVGRNSIVDQLLASPALGKPTHMEVGTSGTAAAVGDTTITGAFGRVALTSKTRGANNVLTMVANFGAGVATGTLQEAGIWDASTSGTLWARATYTSIPKGASDTLQVTWTWTIG